MIFIPLKQKNNLNGAPSNEGRVQLQSHISPHKTAGRYEAPIFLAHKLPPYFNLSIKSFFLADANLLRSTKTYTEKMTGEHMKLDAMAVEFPAVHGHPNRMPFEGVLTLVDVPSDRAPSGSRGHRVILSRKAAELALPSLLGMAVDFRPDWDGHDARSKCGILTEADIVGQKLTVGGYLYARDFPEVEEKLCGLTRGNMGMSYELADAHVDDMRSSIWKLNRVTFTGAAILLREKAAYRQTSFRLKSHVTHGKGVRVAAHRGAA